MPGLQNSFRFFFRSSLGLFGFLVVHCPHWICVGFWGHTAFLPHTLSIGFAPLWDYTDFLAHAAPLDLCHFALIVQWSLSVFIGLSRIFINGLIGAIVFLGCFPLFFIGVFIDFLWSARVFPLFSWFSSIFRWFFHGALVHVLPVFLLEELMVVCRRLLLLFFLIETILNSKARFVAIVAPFSGCCLRCCCHCSCQCCCCLIVAK